LHFLSRFRCLLPAFLGMILMIGHLMEPKLLVSQY
jgi:hypothetical protein